MLVPLLKVVKIILPLFNGTPIFGIFHSFSNIEHTMMNFNFKRYIIEL